MTFHLLKVAIVVAMTHGFRALGRRAGPRLGGLALGLPITTAVALVGSGFDRGLDYSVRMAETSLLGLVGAVALPLAYAWAIERQGRFCWAPVSGVLAYLGAAMMARMACPVGAGGSLGFATLAVLSACAISSRSPMPVTLVRFRRFETSPGRTWALRTAVPVACLVGSLLVGEATGPSGAGLMSTFPGLTLTVLILTHLEAGPTAAARMARALPPANLGMVAFLGAYRLGCPQVGLTLGTMLAYLAALATLGVIAMSGTRKSIATYRPALRLWLSRQEAPLPSWPRSHRRFKPLVERIAV